MVDNIFFLVEEVIVCCNIEEYYIWCFDIVVYVNGMVFGVIELKKLIVSVKDGVC